MLPAIICKVYKVLLWIFTQCLGEGMVIHFFNLTLVEIQASSACTVLFVYNIGEM